MQPFVIPTIFTAVNQFSTPIKSMTSALDGLTGRMAAFAVQAAGAAAVFGGVVYTAKGMADYQTEISNLSAVTGATGSDLDVFKAKIRGVADETKKSMVFVAQAFTAVDNNMPELHKDADALGLVTKEAIILAKAGREDLAPAAEQLTMSMNQFGLKSTQAAGAVDALAAGAVYGSSRISETAEALQVFGTVAANIAHVTFAESVALVELGSKFDKGAEAGTRFRNILLNMTNIKPGTEISMQMQRMGVDVRKVTNTTLPLYDRLKEISKIKGSPMLMEGLFDKRNVAMAAGLFSRIDKYQSILQGTSTTGLAEEMATTNTNNIMGAIERFGTAWQNIFITSGQANAGLSVLTGTIQFLTKHLDGIVTTGVVVVELFGVWKLGLFAVRNGIMAVNFVQGIATAINGQYATSCFATTAGMNGMAAASFFLEASLLSLSLATGGIIAILGVAYYAFNDGFDAATHYNKAIDETKNGFVLLAPAITQAEVAQKEYNKAMKDFNELKEFEAYNEYLKKKGTLHFMIMNAVDAFIHPELSRKATAASLLNEPNAFMPDVKDFPGLDTAALNPALPQKKDGKDGDNGTQKIEVHINNNTGHDVDFDKSGAPGVKVTSTTGTWMRQ